VPTDRPGAGLDLLLPPAIGPGGRRAALEDGLREAIRDGRLAPGAPLPSTRALARDLGVARGTVVEAYAQLVAEGWLTTRPGAGTAVAATAGRPAPEPGVPVRPAGARPAHDLRPGRPDVSAFPRAAWLRALRTALRSAPDDVLSYGDPRGLAVLRTELAAYLGRTRGVRTTADDIVVVTGYVQALDLLARVLLRRGATAVAMESPMLDRHRGVVTAHGLAVVDVPVDDRGAAVEVLDDRAPVGAIVLSPGHQHPLGTVLSADRRSWILDWAQRTGGLVVEDDYDGELRYDRAPVGALQGRDPGLVAYAGTTSKTLAPGLRLGWLATPPPLTAEVVAVKYTAEGQRGAMDQLALAELLRTGAYDRHVRRMRLRYRARRDHLVAALAEHVPGIRISGTAAGLHLLAELPPDGPSPDAVIEAAAARSLAVTGLHQAHHGGAGHRPALVIGYGTPPEHGFGAAVDALIDTFADAAGPRSTTERR
jgi:GntR family transcriptional regulator / MocR family aminotransferase